MRLGTLTAAQRRLYYATTTGTHYRRVQITISNRNGQPVASFTNTFVGGAIHGDDERDPVTWLEAGIIDPDQTLAWAYGDHKSHHARVVDARFVPELDDWVEDVSFTGPLWDFTRQADVVQLTAQGNERKAMGSVRRVFHRRRKAKASAVVRALLTEAGAAAGDLLIPSLNATLPERVTIGVHRGKDRDKDKAGHQGPKRQVLRATSETTYWAVAKRIAEAIDRDLYVDGRGRFIMAKRKTRPTIKLTSATLLGPVDEKRGGEGEQTNTWHIIGANPKGPRKQIEVEVGLPKRHPASAWSLRWNGEPRKIIERIENRQLRSRKAALQLGRRRRDQAIRELVTREAAAVPLLTWIRPRSLAKMPTPSGRAAGTVRRWTIPLGPGADPMTIGYNRRLSWQSKGKR
jgi:hypothetical protein